MTKYREIIRLTSLGFTQRNIMASCGVAQKTVVKVQRRARELKLEWPLDDSMTDIALGNILFPKSDTPATESNPSIKYMGHGKLIAKNCSIFFFSLQYVFGLKFC